MTAPASRIRHTLITIAKLTLAAAILTYLVIQAQRNEGFARLVHEPKQWPLLAAGLACTFAAISLSFVRWHVLVRALGLGYHFLDTMRLGALGFALNFVSLGSIGGDLFKAVLLAKDFPGRRTEAVATVMADRVMGLLLMLALASASILASDWTDAPQSVEILCRTILLVTAGAVAGVLLVLFIPALSGPWVRDLLERIPLVGSTAARLVAAVGIYRNQKRQIALAAAISLVVDVLFILSFYFIARGLPVRAPSLVQHFMIVPIANLAGAIPATPSGLGTLEAAVDTLYQAVPSATTIPPGDGTMVALAQRLTMIIVAGACVLFYVTQKSDLRQVLHEAEEAAEAEAAGGTP